MIQMLSGWYCIATFVEQDAIRPYPNVTGANGMFSVLCFNIFFDTYSCSYIPNARIILISFL
jgi:hypothetical protein